MNEELPPAEAIAVIGMSGRFPGAGNPDEFWQNLIAGKDSITRFESRVESDGSKYVGARSMFDKPDMFDASFFGIYPKEAELMDPQHRVFLECAWEAIEHGGYDPHAYAGMIGVYAGLSLNSYLLHNLGKAKELAKNYQVAEYQTMLGNDKDFLPVRVSYKLNLRGPSMTIQTACSTSLVAICQAATSLLTYQCDMALAGGVSISFPQQREYLYTEEGMVSGDGTVRAFDQGANGTVFGHGCGVVLLKRLSEAVADRDPILAVIKGWAVNNDGSDKIGFAAPGLNAQAEVIALAQASAGVSPQQVSYIEAHGTGTPLGDPIEIAALTKAFRDGGAVGNGYCAIGTGKTHIGHLDVAAGVTGLIKTIQQFRFGKIPALLHFTAPNPRIDFANSPLAPVAEMKEWLKNGTPRIAGVSAFGVGGTNAHVVMEEAPEVTATSGGRKQELFVLSAKTATALEAMSANLAAHMECGGMTPLSLRVGDAAVGGTGSAESESSPSQSGVVPPHSTGLSDVSYTLAMGRRAFPFRRHVVAGSVEEAVAKLREGAKSSAAPKAAKVAFLFPGQGSQYLNMGRELLAEPAFREAVDICASLLQGHLGLDIRETLYPSEATRDEAEQRIHQTWLTQPCIFVVEYALAKLWMSWGVQPCLLIGHSVGEYVAAVLAGTFSLPDALGLLAVRARLMQGLPSGAMLAVRQGVDELALPEGIYLAAINSPKLCTVSGSHEAIAAYQAELEEKKIVSRLLKTSHAFHSAMMEPMVAPFTAEAAKVRTNAPTIPWISTCTGKAMNATTLADASYWARQLRHEVRFTDALATAYAEQGLVLLEVGPGQALGPFARQHPDKGGATVISTLPASNTANDLADLLNAAGELWKAGTTLDWTAFFAGQERARVHLPTYPFERQSFWIDKSVEVEAPVAAPAGVAVPSPLSVSALPPSPPVMSAPADRRPDLAAKLRAIVLDLSGVAVEDDAATFTELSFDSLFLTQAAQAIQSRFGVKITFRQMLGELSSVAAIAVHLDKEMPAEVVSAPVAVAARVVAAPTTAALLPPAANGGTTIEQLMANQIQLMQALLESQRGATPAAVAPAASGNLPAVKWPVGHTRNAVTNTRFGPFKPIDKGENGGLTETQDKALSELISRYVRKTASSKAYTAEHREHYADPRAVAGFKSLWKEMVYPIVSARSKGAKIWDLDGNEYVDITMGFGTYFFGHSPDWLIEAVEKQLKTGIEIGPQSPIAGKLAKAICELTNMDRATFCNTGSEAVMAAMRLSRTITGRTRIAYFTGDYHGMFEEVLVRGAWVDGVYKAQPIAPGIPQSLVENMLVLDYADPASLEILRAHAHELAAVMVEPVQSRAPGLQPREFMQEVRAITKAAGTALIFDEVVTGFRCHPGGAQAYFGVDADLATYGKVIGGGMPIGVLAGKREYMDALDGGAWNYGDDSFPEVGVTFFAGTFVRHPLALAAAWRVVEHLKGEGPRLQIEVTERVDRLCRTLNDYLAAIGVPIRLPNFSAYAVIEHAPELKHASLLWYFLRERGVHVWEGRPLYFTTAHTDEDFDRIIRGFTEAVADMQAAGFLPGSSAVVEAPTVFPRRDVSLTTEAQREIFHSLMMGDDANCSYNESNVIRFEGELDAGALRTALADIVTRHPALRSSFSEDGQQQIFHAAPREAAVTAHDFSALTADVREMNWAQTKEDEARTPFDLVQGPLLRLQLAKLTADRHELLFTAHHLVCDGWSFGMILMELAQAYNARKASRLPMLPPAMSFADYARLELSNKDSEERGAAENFWVAKFSNGAPVLELPTDRARPQLKTYAGAMEAITLDAEGYARLKKASPKLGGTLFATLLGTFATLLHRLTGQDDLVIGVPAAGQTRVGRDELVGHCLNFLPLRLNTAAERSFRTFAAEVKEQVLEAYDHQDYTFGSLLKKLTLPRDTSRLPLVTVMFNIDKSGSDQIGFDGLGFDVATNPKRHVNFDLFFNLVQTDERMIVECEYNTDLHDAATIRRWLGCFEQLIESVTADGDTALQSLPILAATESKQVLVEWNATQREYPRTATLPCLISHVAARVPEKAAVSCGSQALTYGQLELRANAIAARLQIAGVKRGHLVGIHLERSTEMVAGLLAILKCGAAYVPMDPSFPAERLAFMVEDAHMPVILSQTSLHRELPASQATVLLADEIPGDASGFTSVKVDSEDTAYVIFTSGSTGRPKGVRIPHRAVVNFLNSMRREPGLRPDDVLLAVTTLSFDIAGLEIFLPVTTGAEVVIATREITIDGNRLAETISSKNITVLQATPATWRLLLEGGWSGKPGFKALVGGEAVPRDLVNRLAPLCGEIWNVYGPTETTIWSTTAQVFAGEGPVLIGRPIDNTQVYIVNNAMLPQPVGIAGELLIGGDGLAEGYHDRPDLTADRFITLQGVRLYRTGDLARWLPDGSIECLGRMDHQVKVRGFRIELGDIETHLEQHPAVAQAVAHVNDGRLIAYVKTGANGGNGSDGTAIWRDQWDLLYKSAIDQSGSDRLDRLDSVIAGWAGATDIDAQVGEWIDATAARLRKYGPRRIYEIGCGTGQILSRFASETEVYWASDISEVAIEALRKNWPHPHLKFFHRPADEFTDIPAQYFDTVVINSVAQYFPDANYLAKVLQGAAKCLRPGGRIFLGDIQSNALLAAHHAEILRERSPDGTTCRQLREKVAQRLARETELSLDPAWFDRVDVPGLAHAEIQLRRGRMANETTTYHYDVILHIGEKPAVQLVTKWRQWERLNLEQLEAILAEGPDELAIAGIPDVRLNSPLGFLRALEHSPEDGPLPFAPGVPGNALSAEALFAVAESTGYRAHVRWRGNGTAGLIDVIFLPAGSGALPLWPIQSTPAPLANVPWQDAPSASGGELPALLRLHLTGKLPDYMVPTAFVVLENFPLTPNGKVDRKALPAPGVGEEASARDIAQPKNETERQLVEIWKQVLGLKEIGATDDIFELGGDSILIFQISTRATRAGLKLTPAQVFRHRNIAAIAADLTAAPEPAAAGSTIQRVNRDAYRRKS
ncbi:hybrid non-ribosomal peptide synthetase/type I polyketide synthase [Haloferula sp. BvORR071]|uniref:hybrid non-ribosomal peptide synthetase/type I polyketide synthase n=1 Tax=Haloferula sp. BvORR071 TaxID=1396141 RepID=UPI0006982734|nr:hybrid non-ribosomal peptide synthetase/type I polyketide synthase [Haloferula sp. BvORR071]